MRSSIADALLPVNNEARKATNDRDYTNYLTFTIPPVIVDTMK